MVRGSGRLWTIGITAAAITAAAAAAPEAPVEATAPGDADIPAAEEVEHVLRATYPLPAGRGPALAAFLWENAAPGIDVRFENERLTVVAPAEAQRALGTFISTCLSKEPAETPGSNPATEPFRLVPTPDVVPNYPDPSPGEFGFETRPKTGGPSRTFERPKEKAPTETPFHRGPFERPNGETPDAPSIDDPEPSEPITPRTPGAATG